MSGITGLGTTYNLPNYTGILYALTPSETPLFSAIGGLTGGAQTSSTEFEWEFYDLRVPGQNTVVEGADAPDAQQRVRSNETNVVEIHHEAVEVSYSKLAATAEKSGVNNNAVNPVTNELDWQVRQMLVQMVRDVEYSFVNGVYANPSTNADARKTRGLLSAITTNRQFSGTSVKAGATTATSTDAITASAHGFADGDVVYLRDQATTTTLPDGTYWVRDATTNTFKVAATSGGDAVDIDADGTVDVYKGTELTSDLLGDLLQSVYDNGGITNQATATLVVNSDQKRAISKAYTDSVFQETSRNVGGVNVNTVETDFGTLNVMLDRMVPRGKLIVASLDQLVPVYREIPGKGHFFVEPLAKTGASDKSQLYGEVGLAYGNERAHGVLDGLKV